ncbi:RNA polymerase II transcription factor SIII subunit A-domain-containing protein [Mycotypha africana]|uniref:RNA polymerase II transcription factor SIII subunit A-domain-containing protein n=1 Tax=Mycotypha africana TaxID=64632 RepID=UPI00230061FA|nr:RNA polymerase II transcription factor SIII subunit A-domain-containing protein [Mycotypha africana]KAI8979234.1 RNA polymerase II transcription factor SIII subunit A-domain-containing protein [Mycotypha africana]
MPRSVKSLKTTCQNTLAKYLDVLTDVGCVPYNLLKPSLALATPQQLYRIEKANPEIAAVSDELWLRHCLSFKDISDEYHQGQHQDPTQWRDLYLNRYAENERKKQLIREKVRSQYSKIQNEKEQKSIKVLRGVVPASKRTYEAARRSTMSKLMQQTRKQAEKATSIYYTAKRPGSQAVNNRQHSFEPAKNISVPIIRAPKRSSPLIQVYESFKYNQPPLRHYQPLRNNLIPSILPQTSNIPTSPEEAISSTRKTSVLLQDIKDPKLLEKVQKDRPERPLKRSRIGKQLMKDNSDEPLIAEKAKRKKPVALVNFDIFNELQ